jgi:hypothetical protein
MVFCCYLVFHIFYLAFDPGRASNNSPAQARQIVSPMPGLQRNLQPANAKTGNWYE